MNLTSTLRTVVELDGTDYTLDPTLGGFAVVYTYDGGARGLYTYIEYYNDPSFAEINAEDAADIVREHDKLAAKLTAAQLAQYIDGDRLLASELVRL
ncbi:hypothetical protein OG225_02435 [Nocardia sp. NBC_01377]|uniref:hypothetical protein n=1 Tax=Nocardia TaxID=1817 RepID=UPI001C23A27D|nr:hypothetical protein [Nocardia noduli]